MLRVLLSTCLFFLAANAMASPAPADTGTPAAAADDSAFPGLDDLMARAKKGEPGAQEALGNRYEKGNGVTQDYAEAAKWYRMAAEQGFTKAEAELGILYSKGLGVKLDYEEAYFWLSMSFDPFKAEENKILDEVKSYLSSEQQEIVNNRINNWRPNKKRSTAVANSESKPAKEDCATRDLVPILKLKLHAPASCKEAYKSMRYTCSGQETTCAACHDAFINFDTVCNQQQESNAAYACARNEDCGLVDTACNQPYEPIAVNRQFMMQERERHSWPIEDCGRRLEVKQSYRAVCLKLECSAVQANAAE